MIKHNEARFVSFIFPIISLAPIGCSNRLVATYILPGIIKKDLGNFDSDRF